MKIHKSETLMIPELYRILPSGKSEEAEILVRYVGEVGIPTSSVQATAALQLNYPVVFSFPLISEIFILWSPLWKRGLLIGEG